MSLVSLHSITIAFGGESVLENVSLDIHKGQRICCLGRNGTGKSTLMKIIAGEVTPDTGEIITSPGLRIAYLPQDVPAGLHGTVFEVVASGAGKPGEILNEYHRLEAKDGDSDSLHDLQHYLNEHNGWSIQTGAERVINQLHLDGSVDFNTLSGGMRRRVFLARALVQEPELLLLDEPTNHLDIDSITWLESFLLGSKSTVLFVTHDRRLLRQLATRIVELDRGNLTDWLCNYETFIQRKLAVLDAEEKEWSRFDKKLAREEVWIRQGIKARRTRNEGRVRALFKIREERCKRRERSGPVSMTISEAQRSGNRVIEAENITFSYTEEFLIKNLSLCIMRGDRIGIIGPNGCGKTTLLNLLLGKSQPREGAITFGVNLEIAYFDQLREVLDPEQSVWENVAAGGGDTVYVNGKPKHVISYLRDFLFTLERAKSPVKQLSGGERNRLMLARLFTQPANILVFDEPTNDLDSETLELLEEILGKYNGTVLLVTHDRVFLNNVVTSTLVFQGNGIVKEYVGGYDDWEKESAGEINLSPAKPVAKKNQPGNECKDRNVKKLSFKEKRELESLPERIEKWESEREQLFLQMGDPACYRKVGFITKAKIRIAQIESELGAAYQRWEELEGRPK